MTDTFAITASGTCPRSDCGITVTAVGGGIPAHYRPDRPFTDDDGQLRPARRLGEPFPLTCICRATFEGRVVGLTLEPFQAQLPDEDHPVWENDDPLEPEDTVDIGDGAAQ